MPPVLDALKIFLGTPPVAQAAKGLLVFGDVNNSGYVSQGYKLQVPTMRSQSNGEKNTFADNTVVATIKGQLIRTVRVSGEIQTYGVPFLANLVMVENPDYSKKGRFPLGIYEIEIQYPQGNIFPQ